MSCDAPSMTGDTPSRIVDHVTHYGPVTGTGSIPLDEVRPEAGRPTVPVATHAAMPRHIAATSRGGC
jgi:hypothetical protein